MKKTAVFVLVSSVFSYAMVWGGRAPLRDVWLVEPHHSWITYAKNTSSGEVPHVLRQLSKGQHVDLGYVSGKSYTVQNTEAPGCMNCTSNGVKLEHRSVFHIDVHNAPDSKVVRKAMKKVARIMGRAWSSKMPVDVRVVFGNIGAPNVLVNGGGTYFCRLPSLFNQTFPIAAGESILGRDLNQHKEDKGKYDVLITINTNAPWYYGTDGRTPSDKYDLVTALLREVYHNLLFTGGIFVDVQKLGYDVQHKAKLNSTYISRFDSFLANKDGCAVLGYLKDKDLKEKTGKSGDILLGEAISNEQLYFGTGTDGDLVRLYAPRVFLPNASIYNLDTNDSSDKSIMTGQGIEKGRALHVIGSRILNIQAKYLDAGLKGANENCSRPLLNPAKRPLNTEERKDVSTAKQTTSPHIYIAPEFFDRRVAIGWIVGLSVAGGFLTLILCAILVCVILRMKNKGDDDSSSSSRSLPSTLGKTRPPVRGQNKGYGDRPSKPVTPTYSMSDSFRFGAGNERRGCAKPTETVYTQTKKLSSTVPSSTVPSPTPLSVSPPTVPTPCKKKLPRCPPPARKSPSTKPSSTRPPTRSAAPATVDLFDCS